MAIPKIGANLDSVKQPVKAVDSTTNYYGTLKKTAPELKKTIDKGFGNMHANLLNESDDHTDTQGQSNKVDRMKAMKRRMGKSY